MTEALPLPVRDWRQVNNLFKLAEALIGHAGTHIGFIQLRCGPFLDYARRRVPPSNVDLGQLDLAIRMESKHAMEDLGAALDYAAYATYERGFCKTAGPAAGPAPHLATGEHRWAYFPVARKTECPDQYLKREGSHLGVEWARYFWKYQQFGRPPDQRWLPLIHEFGNEAKHRGLPITEVLMSVETDNSGRIVDSAPRPVMYSIRGSGLRTPTILFVEASREAKSIVRDLRNRVK